MSTFGHCDGETCKRNGCTGIIDTYPAENCSCHISPPCFACTSPRNFCQECDWQEKDDQVINDFVVSVDKKTGVHKSWEPRPLDPTKIDWRSLSHTNASMIKEGVYPSDATIDDVRKMVIGTFGGHFEHFGNGRFKYIAYTD